MPFKYRTLLDRIIANSVLSRDNSYDGTPCWEWIGATTNNRDDRPYPRMTRRLKRGPRKGMPSKEFAHRVVVRNILGRKLTTKMVVMHKCNNSICVNPAHLSGGKQKTNIKQAVREGRHGNQYSAPVRDARMAA